jgi:Mob1/phocein family
MLNFHPRLVRAVDHADCECTYAVCMLVLPILSLTLSNPLLILQVALPQGESCAAWVAVHAIDFFNDVTTIWAVSTSMQFCRVILRA